MLLAALLVLAAATERPLVLSLAGVRVGTRSTDKDVVALHGPGCLVESEPHAGGRYYRDAAGLVTLHASIGTDGITDSVELQRGEHLPLVCRRMRGSFVSSRLSASATLEHGLRLGMSRAELEKRLGPPSKVDHDGGAEVLIYETTADKDPRVTLGYEATYRFEADQLTRVALYDGD